MRLLCLALAFGLTCTETLDSSEITGKWRSILTAADNVVKIQEGGDLRPYVREVQCLEACKKLAFIVYMRKNGECFKFTTVAELSFDSEYVALYSGTNHVQLLYQRDGVMMFYYLNVDEEGKETRVILALGREGERDSLTAEEEKHLATFLEQKGIPAENTEYLAETDTCPE